MEISIVLNIILSIVCFFLFTGIIMLFTKPENFLGENEQEIKYVTPAGTVALQEYEALKARMNQYLGVPDWRMIMPEKYQNRKYIEVGMVNETYHDVVVFGGNIDIQEARDIANRLPKILKFDWTVAPAIAVTTPVNNHPEYLQFNLNGWSGIIQSMATHAGYGGYVRYARIYLTETASEIPMVNNLLAQELRSGQFQFADSETAVYNNELIDTVIGMETSFTQAPTWGNQYGNYQPSVEQTPQWGNNQPVYSPQAPSGNIPTFPSYGQPQPQQYGGNTGFQAIPQAPSYGQQQPLVQPIQPLRPNWNNGQR